MLFRGFRDADFGAARVGDERMGGSMARDFGKKIERRGDGKSNINQVGVFEGWSEIARERLVDSRPKLRFADDFGTVPAKNMDICRVFAQSQPEGAADEAGAKDSDAGDEMGSHRKSIVCIVQATRRPMAGAMIRSSAINCVKVDGSSDCAPSERARSGSL